MALSAEDILWEDNHLIAINKRVGQLVQADTSGDLALEDELKQFIKESDNKPGNVYLGVTHRIDRPVSGVVLFAKTSKALARINALFKEGTIKKTYWAIVKNRPPKSTDLLVHYLVRDTKKNKTVAYPYPRNDAKESRLNYRVLGQSVNYYFLEIDLLTGRHHQIRCQLAKIDCPIKGDLKYGFPRSNPDGGICLHSRSLEFEHPVKKEIITIKASAPLDTLWSEFVKVNEP